MGKIFPLADFQARSTSFGIKKCSGENGGSWTFRISRPGPWRQAFFAGLLD
jgi:hypothetical protein